MSDTPLSLDDVKDLYKKARVPLRAWNTRFAEQGEPGNLIQRYLDTNGGQYDNDYRDARGLTLVGSVGARNTLFPAITRSLILRSEDALYMQLSDMADFLDNPDDASHIISRMYDCFTLCIDGFFDESIDCRFGPRELRRIEALIRDRINNEKRVFISSDRVAGGMDWYSQSIRTLLIEHNRTMTL